MVYPAPHDNTPKECPECHKKTRKWRAMVFGTFYNLGDWFCEDPNCPESYEKRFDLLMRK